MSAQFFSLSYPLCEKRHDGVKDHRRHLKRCHTGVKLSDENIVGIVNLGGLNYE